MERVSQLRALLHTQPLTLSVLAPAMWWERHPSPDVCPLRRMAGIGVQGGSVERCSEIRKDRLICVSEKVGTDERKLKGTHCCLRNFSFS